MPLVPEAPGAAQPSGLGPQDEEGQVPAAAWPLAPSPRPRLSLSQNWKPFLLGDRPEALPGQGPATCPLGTRGGRVGQPLGLRFPDCTVREAVMLLLIQTRPLTGVQGRLLVSSQTDPGLWAAGGHPCRLEGPSLLLKWTWAQISAWAPSDWELKSSAVWASVSLPV